MERTFASLPVLFNSNFPFVVYCSDQIKKGKRCRLGKAPDNHIKAI